MFSREPSARDCTFRPRAIRRRENCTFSRRAIARECTFEAASHRAEDCTFSREPSAREIGTFSASHRRALICLPASHAASAYVSETDRRPGNPGPRYSGTRHNVGWRVVEDLAAALGAGSWREKFDAFVAEAPCGGQKVALARPLTVHESCRAWPCGRRWISGSWTSRTCWWSSMTWPVEAGRIAPEDRRFGGRAQRLASVIAHVGTGRLLAAEGRNRPAPRGGRARGLRAVGVHPRASRPAVDDAIRPRRGGRPDAG